MRENMNHRRKMERLLEEVRQEQQAMDNCSHGDWTEAKFDPEEIREPYGSRQVGAGSDPYWEPEGYTTKEKPRWSRECKKCGKIEYTYTQDPVIVGHKPSFK
jgi:hypothetical protein